MSRELVLDEGKWLWKKDSPGLEVGLETDEEVIDRSNTLIAEL